MNLTKNPRLFVYAQFALLALLLFWPDNHDGWGILDFLFEFIGVLFFIAGGIVLYFAIRSLFIFSVPALHGTWQQQVKQALRVVWPEPSAEAKLVTTGVFKRMRHPIYAGLIWVGYGIGIASGPVPHLFFAIALHVVLHHKSKLEETFLLAKFPEYASYQAKTGRFFPKVED